MGSILIRHVPNGVHRSFKKNCRQQSISMEQAIVQLIERDVVNAKRGKKAGRRGSAKKAGRAAKKGATARRRAGTRRAKPTARRRTAVGAVATRRVTRTRRPAKRTARARA